jgi:NAD(P)H-hydrate epimerase
MPIPIISVGQMREWENATWKSGQTEAEVIRRVGKAVAEMAIRLTKPGELIIVLAGRGHNGADARNALEQLEERRIDVLQVHDPKEDFEELETLLKLRPALIIDGLFGIGINRPLDAAWIRFIERINGFQLPVLAVDLPSGLNADTGEPQGAAVKAMLTLTVGAPKIGMLKRCAWPYVGRLEVATHIGLIPCPFKTETNWTASEDFAGFPPLRSAASHKGTFGHLAMVAGSLGYHGAAVLAARAAQRARPGLITLFPHEPAYLPCAAQLQAVMAQPWSPEKLPANFDALLAGPGLAAADVPETLKQQIRELWKTSQMPTIVDASALQWLPSGPTPSESIRVITPHPGEAARLLEKSAEEIQADRAAALRELSKQFGNCWIVLKGHQTLIGRSTGDLFVNSSGNPALAQGGSGDALGGFLAGLLAQKQLQTDPLQTIRYAVWQHGATADQLQRTRPNWVMEDLVEALGSGA